MAEPIEWLADGSPYSPRFGDRYRSEDGGLNQARDVFLGGCGLPAAWASQPQWRILETGFGLGLNFLVAWQAWRDDPLRPRLLHVVSTEAYPASADDVLRAASAHPALVPLARQLCGQLWGLLPGFHRLSFENGCVLLTLCIGDTKTLLRQLAFEADSIYLDGFSPQKNPDMWDLHTLKAVARYCRRGTRMASWTIARAVRDALAQAGFVVQKTPGAAPKRDNLQGEYNPAWTPRKAASPWAASAALEPSSCIVVGAGLAGAAVASSLARRGWQVLVLDAAELPASGASGLPAGLMGPHFSPDDSLLSRLCRAGSRIALAQAQQLLQAGHDWNPTGVLQRKNLDNQPKPGPEQALPPAWLQDWPGASADWARPASAAQLAQAGLAASSQALWSCKAGWIKPASLVKAWLAAAGIRYQGGAAVSALLPHAAGWQAIDQNGDVLAQARLVVLAAAVGSARLAEQAIPAANPGAAAGASPLPLQAVRGQVSQGFNVTRAASAAELPNGADLASLPFPVNGHGSFIPALPLPGGTAWLAGATFERDMNQPAVTAAGHAENQARLAHLLPTSSTQLASTFSAGHLTGWSGVRCATPNRLPLVGRVASSAAGQIWVSTGMGSRGLTLAALCAELIAAQLHGEPLPVDNRLAQALWPQAPSGV